jgi:hypothetical protein
MSEDRAREKISRRTAMLATLATAGELAIRPAGAAWPGRLPLPSDRGWWRVAGGPLSPLTLGAKGDGVTDDTSALTQALAASDQIDLPAGKVFCCRDLVVPAGKTIGGGGTLKVGDRSRISLSGDGTVVSGISLLSDNALYLLHVSGRGVTISQCRFGGSVGHYILVEAAGSTIADNVFDGGSGTQITSVVFSGPGATDGKFTGNHLSQYTGFGVQTRLGARAIAIRSNVFVNRPAEQDSTLADRQGPVEFQPQARAKRWGALLNGKQTQARVNVAGDGRPAVTLAATAHPGDKVSLLSWDGFEPININSGSADITVDGNQISGSGDSGIVLGSDYRGTTLDAKNTTPQDYPQRVRVTNNTIEFCAQAGIAGTVAVDQVHIENNHISEYGLGASGLVYPSGIVVTGGGATVSGNTVASNGRTTRFGITLNGFLPLAMPPGNGEDIALSGNSFHGDFEAKYFIPNMQAGARKRSIVFPDLLETPYPEAVRLDAGFTRAAPSTARLGYAHAGEGWVPDQDAGPGAVILRNGSYADIMLKDGTALLGSIVTVSVRAKADAGQPYLSVFTTLGGKETAVTCPVASRDWQLYRIRIAMTADLAPQPIRIRTGVSKDGLGHFRDIAVSSVRIPT